MTLHCLVVDPPRPGLSLPGLAGGPLDPESAAALHAASIEDAMAAATESGGELLVNYPAAEQLPANRPTDASPEAELRALAADAVEDVGDVRFEVQVGSSFAARAGNAATHLLTEEDEDSVAVLSGTAPTLGRTALDGAAMKLRRHEAVVGPGTGGRVAYLGLSEPIDFEGAFEPPSGGDGGDSEVEDLVRRAVDAGHEVAFLPFHPVIEDEAGLATLVAEVRARRRGGRNVPEYTAEAVEELGLRVVEEDGVRRVVVSE